jgi:hypothetical protein
MGIYSKYLIKEDLRMALEFWSKSTDKKYTNEFLSFIQSKYHTGVECVQKNFFNYSVDMT